MNNKDQVEYTGNGTAGREADVQPTGFFFQMPKPVGKVYGWQQRKERRVRTGEGVFEMTDRELMQQALDALEHLQTDIEWQYKSPTRTMLRKVEKALRARLAQPEQPDFSKAGFGKPQREEGCAECGKKSSDGWALYCVKCTEREWVGLTKKETLELLEKNIDRPFSLLVAVRDKLKEKNAPDL